MVSLSPRVKGILKAVRFVASLARSAVTKAMRVALRLVGASGQGASSSSAVSSSCRRRASEQRLRQAVRDTAHSIQLFQIEGDVRLGRDKDVLQFVLRVLEVLWVDRRSVTALDSDGEAKLTLIFL